MPDIVEQRFEEWTLGKGPREQRVSIFNRIRDIPYRVVPELTDWHVSPRKLLELGCGSCSPKHFLLGHMFANLDIPVTYVSFPYSWNQPQLDYPADLRKLSESLPIEYHLACKAQIEDRWVYVDATWDTPLRRAGFPVDESWDGISNTHIAVDPIDEIEHDTADARAAYVKQQKAGWTEEDHVRSAEFIEQFNAWLAELRAEVPSPLRIKSLCANPRRRSAS